jgi:signal transduction histidine kinase
MNLRTKLMLVGAVAPTLALIAATAIGGWRLRSSMTEDLDEHLAAQASIERISMFDGPHGRPHVHPPDATMPAPLDVTTAHASIYDAVGALVTERLPGSPAPDALTTVVTTLRISSSEIAGQSFRILQLPTRSAQGDAFILWLALPLGPIDHTMMRYVQTVVAVIGTLGAVLLALQLWVANRWNRRIAVLVKVVPSLPSGGFLLASEPHHDELSTLRSALIKAGQHVTQVQQQQERFLRNAAHELRTPLAIIKTEAELALRRPRSNDDYIAALGNIGRETTRAAALASSLLDLEAAKCGIRNLQPCDLQLIMQEAASGFTNLAKTKDVIIIVGKHQAAIVDGDDLLLRRAIDNLLDNALKHSPSGGVIELTLSSTSTQVEVLIADQGPGIAIVEQHRVFEPFYQIQTDHRGAGVGLAIVQDIARLHGGRAAVLDNGQAGCTMLLTIPVRPASDVCKL